MPEIPDVVAGTAIEADWGNPIRDRSVQRYPDAATRDSSDPTPTAGQVSYLADVGQIQFYHGGAWRSFMPTGVIMPFGGSNAPAGFLICDGQAVSRTTYANLYAVIGTTFGAGDGSTTFNLPDLRGRYVMGVATSGAGNSLGATFGSKDHTHSMAHTHSMPNHTHTFSDTSSSAGSHSHTLTSGNTSTAGSHTHSNPNTNSAGSHTHSIGVGGATTPSVAQGALGNSGPTHTHSVSSAGSHSHTVGNTGSAGSHSHTIDRSMSSAGSHTHSVSGTTSSSGGGTTGGSSAANTGSNNPPTVALNWIIAI